MTAKRPSLLCQLYFAESMAVRNLQFNRQAISYLINFTITHRYDLLLSEPLRVLY